MDAARYPDDLELALGELPLRDHDFSSWWADHRVRAQRKGRKETPAPRAAELDLDFQVLDVRGGTDQSPLVSIAEPGMSSAEGQGCSVARKNW
jgi:hypothetical protein